LDDLAARVLRWQLVGAAAIEERGQRRPIDILEDLLEHAGNKLLNT
jgi:hypothetical protein